MTDVVSLDNIEALQKQINGLKESIKAQASTAFKGVADQLFEKYPKLKSFSWTQYTPYFNDGDECVFSVNQYSFKIVSLGEQTGGVYDYDEDEEDEDERYIDPGTLKYYENYPEDAPDNLDENRWKYELADDIVRLQNALGEDTLRGMFGDHVQVIVDRNVGVTTEEYYHD